MDTMELLQHCGITLKQKTPSDTHRVKAVLSFLGAENYVLAQRHTEIDVHSGKDGFNMTFVKAVEIAAEEMLGVNPNIRTAVIVDVNVNFPGSPIPGLSMASLHPGVYPRVLRDHDVLRVSG